MFLDGSRLSHTAAAGSAPVRVPQKKATAVLGSGPVSGAGGNASEQGVHRVREQTLLVRRRRPREQPNSERVAGRVGSESGRHGASVHAQRARVHLLLARAGQARLRMRTPQQQHPRAESDRERPLLPRRQRLDRVRR